MALAGEDQSALLADWQFMAALVEAAGNLVFQLTMNSVRELYLPRADAFAALVADRGELVKLYARAAACVSDGDGDGAAAAIEQLAASAGGDVPVSGGLDSFIAAAPWPQRAALRVLLALARRPRGAALLAHVPLAEQAACSTLALGRYDDPAVAGALGWDADAVVARGRALRRAEGRP